MHNIKKLLAGVLALMMVIGLLACGKEETPAPPADGQEITETPIASIGTVVLVGTSRTIMHYNSEGNVVAISDQNGIACFSSLVDKPCAEAAGQIIQESKNDFTAPFLLIKQNAGSLEPDEKFLQGIVAAVKKELGDLPMIVSPAADQNAMCYFSAETAKAVLAAYLGNPEDMTYTVTSDAENGYYQISTSSANGTLSYTVGALYGSVTEQPEIVEDFTDIPDEQYFPDYEVIDPSWEFTEESALQG